MNRIELSALYQEVRHTTASLCEPLLPEDHVVQSMPDVSPPKWHLGHTTWFFEQLGLQNFVSGYTPFHERYHYIFNSYYESFGRRVARNARGLLSRPPLCEVNQYRAFVDERITALIATCVDRLYPEIARLIELGLHHEQQHQELLVTDIKHIFATNPLHPTYYVPAKRDGGESPGTPALAVKYLPIEGGIIRVGAPQEGFAYDNERPRHEVLLRDFCLMNRLVTCGEYLEFMQDGGYQSPLLWHSDGWEVVQREGWQAPLYWWEGEGQWKITTLSGTRPVDPHEPVAHVSFYEGAAFARWARKRLPTEAEWERAASTLKTLPSCGNFLEDRHFHPVACGQAAGVTSQGLSQIFGDLWEWTGSAYLPYPGYQQEDGPLGEYNGKFMSNQMVLRGGSCATPRNHIRASYRNFFPCDKRWQFSGIRLAKDAH